MHRAGAVRDIACKTARTGGDRLGKKRAVAIRAGNTGSLSPKSASRCAASAPLASAVPPAQKRKAANRAPRQRAHPRTRRASIQHEIRGAFQRIHGLSQARLHFAKGGGVTLTKHRNGRAHIGDFPAHHFALRQREFPLYEVDRLNAIGAFIDRRNSRVAEKLRSAGFLDIAMPP